MGGGIGGGHFLKRVGHGDSGELNAGSQWQLICFDEKRQEKNEVRHPPRMNHLGEYKVYGCSPRGLHEAPSSFVPVGACVFDVGG